ncbi:hypothetical protein EV217_5383 [Phyllobacterium myrsinacearum]|uniref:hypothetical protein n=1 Tax=Phyllobacterium myrsinacearum TaxID=28101 RepID=UPI001029F79E|nr:hypothetical protein [Phyllobacterium myrsinacearum]RZS69885.1 hypothetical protein EV217_5383 [Phyllobacterium myrsinacearum]
MHRSNIEREPEYVRERTGGPQNLGRVYLLSLALCAALIATTAVGYESEWPDIMTVTASTTNTGLYKRADSKTSLTFCDTVEHSSQANLKPASWRRFDI